MRKRSLRALRARPLSQIVDEGFEWHEKLQDPVRLAVESKSSFEHLLRGSCVYFIQVSSGPIKIGYASRDVYERLANLQVGNHEEMRLLAVASGTAALERALHKRLARHCVRGEWFRDCDEVRAAIAEIGVTAPPPGAPCEHEWVSHPPVRARYRCARCGAGGFKSLETGRILSGRERRCALVGS